MDNTIVQVPVTKAFRNEMAEIANNMGFSSLQDLIRFTLTQIKNKVIVPTMASNYPSEELSSQAIARYDKIANDIDRGKVKTMRIDDTLDMIKYLDDHS